MIKKTLARLVNKLSPPCPPGLWKPCQVTALLVALLVDKLIPPCFGGVPPGWECYIWVREEGGDIWCSLTSPPFTSSCRGVLAVLAREREQCASCHRCI